MGLQQLKCQSSLIRGMLLAVPHFPVQLEKLYKLVMQIYQFVRQQDKLWSSYSISRHIFPSWMKTKVTDHIFVKDCRGDTGKLWE